MLNVHAHDNVDIAVERIPHANEKSRCCYYCFRRKELPPYSLFLYILSTTIDNTLQSIYVPTYLFVSNEPPHGHIYIRKPNFPTQYPRNLYYVATTTAHVPTTQDKCTEGE